MNIPPNTTLTLIATDQDRTMEFHAHGADQELLGTIISSLVIGSHGAIHGRIHTVYLADGDKWAVRTSLESALGTLMEGR